MDGARDLTTLSEYRDRRARHRPQVPAADGVRGAHRLENLELALARPKGVFRTLFGRLTPAQRERIDEVLETIGLTRARTRPAGLLSHGQKQWLEIGMLLAQDPKVLLVDEPVAGMTHAGNGAHRGAAARLGGQAHRRRRRARHGVRSQHRPRVTVLHEGRVLADGTMDEVQSDPHVVEVYLGE